MTILPFTIPKVIPNLNFFLLLNTKEDILKNVGNQTKTIDFHGIFSILWKSMRTSSCSGIHILHNIFCVQQKKEIHTDLEQPEGE